MKLKFLTLISISFLIIGCNELKTFEKDGQTFYSDNNGQIFSKVDTSFINLIEVQDEIDFYNYNLNVDLNLKYMNEKVYYNVVISDIDSQYLNRTEYIKDFQKIKKFNLHLKSKDGFEIYKLEIEHKSFTSKVHKDNIKSRMSNGTFDVSKNEFKSINKLEVSIQ